MSSENIKLINIETINNNNKDYDNEDSNNEDDKLEILIKDNQETDDNNEINNLEGEDNENKPNKKEHKYWVDILRIISSYMVILVHSTSHRVEGVPILTSQWDALVFWDSISRSCVPLFIMISGIFFLDPNKEIPLSKLYKKYILRIVKILVFWNIFYGTVDEYLVNSFNDEHDMSFKGIARILIFYFFFGNFHLWYLYMCIGLYMVTPLLRLITKDKTMTKYFLVLGISLSQVIPFISIIFYYFVPSGDMIRSNIESFIGRFVIFMVGGYTTYYVLGYYLSNLDIKKERTKFIIYCIGIISLFGTCIIKLIACYKLYDHIIDFGDYNAFNVTLSAIGIFIFHKYFINNLLNKLLQYKIFKTLILTLSNLSLGCYVIHMFYRDLFIRLKFHPYAFNTYFFPPIYALIIYIVSNITAYIIKKIPILKEFV